MKQRLLGAVILAALLVILVPELLDGAGHKSRYAKQLQIPPEPVFQPMPPLPAAEPAAPVAVTKTPPAGKSPVTKQAVKKVDPLLNAWALQVGSFSDYDNARILRDKLRAESYAAYIDVKKTPGKKIWRVRIGPELDKRRLEKLKKRLLKQRKIKAMVVKQG